MKQTSKYTEIDEARKLLGLPESATMAEIKKNHRKLIKKWHPDTSVENNKDLSEKMTRKINQAYKCLIEYCNHYKFSFTREEVEKYDSGDEWWFKRFGNDPVWGSYNSSDKDQ